MLKEELTEKISKYFKLTNYEAEKIFDDIFGAIMDGVKNDKIVDLDNFGEFIIKQNGNNKSVEFLAKQLLEDDLNSSRSLQYFQPQTEMHPEEVQTSSSAEAVEQFVQPPVATEPLESGFSRTEELSSTAESSVPVKPPEKNVTSAPETTKSSSQYMSSGIEEDLKKKREAILNKLAAPSSGSAAKSKISSDVPPPVEEKKLAEHSASAESDDSQKPRHSENGSKVSEEESKKSFSDYFAVVGDESSASPVESEAETSQSELSEEHETSNEEAYEERTPGTVEDERVIPPNVVELHKDIVSNVPYREMVSGARASLAETQVQPREFGVAEPSANGKPYYIWYKDSEPSAQETQTLSVEYELLYQAQKEAEYRSKLKIYVTTFILFFSFVLILLIFSPVIYKVFFNPQETAPVENVQEETTSEETSQQQNNTQQNQPPVANTQTQETQQTPPPQNVTQPQTQVTQTPQTNVQQTPPQTNVQQQPPPQKNVEEPASQKQTETVPPSNTEGLTKNSLGWTDEKYRVIYIILDNNKYTIQESAWDSETKAAKRLSTVESLKIAGMTGNVVKADLGEKGVWYRARFGEFSSLEEARKKAIELRAKERMKIQAMLICFLLLT